MGKLPKKHPWYRPRLYLHFDSPLGYKKSRSIVSSPLKVAKHSFYPLIEYQINSKKIKRNNVSNSIEIKKKVRPIAYAAHLDSHIYSYYTMKLSKQYELKLLQFNIEDSVLAFRALAKGNADFANDAFDIIRQFGNCYAIALDVTGFFDNLDHVLLKEALSKVLDVARLPPDYYAIYKSQTKFSKVNKNELYKTLGIALNNSRKGGRRKLCVSAKEFRAKVADSGLLKVNKQRKGIPQGSPISSLLSNIYMFDFDVALSREVSASGGRYFRYCDDILIIVPLEEFSEILALAKAEIAKVKLEINESKEEICRFFEKDGVQSCDKPLQYLGFIFDGKRKLIRSTALAKYFKRMRRAVRKAKRTMARRNLERSLNDEPPRKLFRRSLYEKFSHLGDSNFIRYGLRSAEIMNSEAIRRQLKPLWKKLIEEIEKD